MNKLFVISSLLSILFGFLFHRNMVLTDAILQLPSHVLELSVTLVVNGCFWNGFLSLAEASGLVNRCSRLFKPFFRWAYPHLEDEDEIIGLLGSNFIANFIGLGSLAMLSGIKAFKALDQINKNKQEASRFMKTLIIFNTTGCSLFPMSIISIRSHFHSQNPLGFIGYTLLIGVMTLCCGIFIQKGVERFGK